MPPCGVFLVRIDRCIITIRITINRTRVVGRASQALLYALSIAAAFLFVSFDMGRDEPASRRRVADRFRDDRNRSGRPGPVGYRCAGTAAAGGGRSVAAAGRVRDQRAGGDRRADTAAGEETPRAGDSGTNSAAQRRAAACRTTPHGKPSGALPGRTAGSTSTSEGPAAGEGNAGDLSGRRKAVTTARARAIRALPTTFRGARWWESCPSLPIRAMSPARSSSM